MTMAGQAQTAGVARRSCLRPSAAPRCAKPLPSCPYCQRLLALLIQDPPFSYAEISSQLGTCVGSIGPMRIRCLDKLRRSPAIAVLINAESDSVHASPDGARR